MPKMVVSIPVQKLIAVAVVALAVVGGLQALVVIVNLNQISIFLNTAFWLWLFLLVEVTLLYDLHFKRRGNWQRAAERHRQVSERFWRNCRTVFSALGARIEHVRHWSQLRYWVNYLLLPGLLFWATVGLLYVNFGNIKMQETFVGLSSFALILNFWYLKEAFSRQQEKVETDIFVALSVVKIYTAAMLFGSALVVMRSYCLDPWLYAAALFGFNFFLIYQALFQHNFITARTLLITAGLSLLQSLVGYWVYISWGYNYFTAAIFLTVVYNLCWGVFHYWLDRSLTKKEFLEILLFSLVVATMVFTTTNFRARISDGCSFMDSGK